MKYAVYNCSEENKNRLNEIIRNNSQKKHYIDQGISVFFGDDLEEICDRIDTEFHPCFCGFTIVKYQPLQKVIKFCRGDDCDEEEGIPCERYTTFYVLELI